MKIKNRSLKIISVLAPIFLIVASFACSSKQSESSDVQAITSGVQVTPTNKDKCPSYQGFKLQDSKIILGFSAVPVAATSSSRSAFAYCTFTIDSVQAISSLQTHMKGSTTLLAGDRAILRAELRATGASSTSASSKALSSGGAFVFDGNRFAAGQAKSISAKFTFDLTAKDVTTGRAITVSEVVIDLESQQSQSPEVKPGSPEVKPGSPEVKPGSAGAQVTLLDKDKCPSYQSFRLQDSKLILSFSAVPVASTSTSRSAFAYCSFTINLVQGNLLAHMKGSATLVTGDRANLIARLQETGAPPANAGVKALSSGGAFVLDSNRFAAGPGKSVSAIFTFDLGAKDVATARAITVSEIVIDID